MPGTQQTLKMIIIINKYVLASNAKHRVRLWGCDKGKLQTRSSGYSHLTVPPNLYMPRANGMYKLTAQRNLRERPIRLPHFKDEKTEAQMWRAGELLKVAAWIRI